MWEKLKLGLSDDSFFYSMLILLVAGSAFGLGRMSVKDAVVKDDQAVSLIEQAFSTSTSKTAATSSAAAVSLAEMPEEKVSTAVVGSKSGTKYHLPDCPGAKRIKPENLITFASIEEAEAAGYTPASNCKGLE
jgi:hypothetical protein